MVEIGSQNGSRARRILTLMALTSIAVASCDKEPSHSMSSVLDELLREKRSKEQVVLKSSDVAVRAGDKLEIQYSGKIVATLQDKEGAGNCPAWIFLRDVKLWSVSTKEAINMAEVECVTGEFSAFSVIDESGKAVGIDGPGISSPDGLLLVTGSSGYPEYGTANFANLAVTDWQSRSITARFDALCSPLKWLDEKRLSVVCRIDGKPHFQTFNGTLENEEKKGWHLRVQQYLHVDTLTVIGEGDGRTLFPVEYSDTDKGGTDSASSSVESSAVSASQKHQR